MKTGCIHFSHGTRSQQNKEVTTQKGYPRMKLKVCLALSLSAVLFANAEQYGDFTYVVTNSTAEITSYGGLDGDVAIPGSISGMTVTIGENAFRYLHTLIHVTISNGVTRIGERAFDECTGLVNVTIPASVNEINPTRVFGGCVSLTNIAVDGANANYCSTNGVLFNKDLTWLIQCPGGKPGEYTIPVGVTNIESAAFRYCTTLTSVTIPEGVSEIRGTTFFGCFDLATVSIPNSVTAIRSAAFQACRSLTNVTLSANVSMVEPTAFSGCDTLSNITADGANANYSSTNGVLYNKDITWLVQCPGGKPGDYTIPAGVSGIGQSAFSGCARLTAVTIPNSVTTIGKKAFSDCTVLTSVYFAGNAPSLGSGVFYSPTTIFYLPGTTGWGATFDGRPTVPVGYAYIDNGDGTCMISRYTGDGADIAIPNTISNLLVTSIDDYAFYWRSSLTSVTIPASVTNMGDGGFSHCFNLTNISVDTSNAFYSSVGGVLFNKSETWLIKSPGGITGTYTMPSSVTNIGNSAFVFCFNLTGITIPNGVIRIEDSAFWNDSGLTSVTIPGSVMDIGRDAFGYCYNLTNISVDASNTVYSSMDGVLFNKSHTTLIAYHRGIAGSYTVPDGVTTIEEGSFDGSFQLTNVTIPSSVTNIGGSAFFHCYGLEGVYFRGNAPTLGSGVFSGDNAATVYYLPETSGWDSFAYSPTVPWNPQVQVDANVGVGTNGFGFTITNGGNPVIVVEACTNLVIPSWSPLATNTLSGGSSSFSDPEWTNSPRRFYRFRSP